MKKLILLFFVMLLAIAFPASAIDLSSGPQAAAAYFPADTKFFVAVRTDEAFIDELETFISTVRTQLPADVPMMGLRDMLRDGMKDAPVDFDTMMMWLGDWVAIGGNSFQAESADQSYFAAALEDQAAFEAYISENAEMFEVSAEGIYTMGSTQMMLGDGVAYFAETGVEFPSFPLESSLLDTEGYQASVGALIADQYNLVTYIDLAAAAAASPDGAAELEAMGIFGDSLGSAAVGFTILDGRVLTIDSAQTGAGEAGATIDPNFARFVPAQSSAVIHATDFTALFNQMMTIVEQNATEQENPMEQLRAGLQMMSIDLDADILSWTTGDYVLFLRADIMGVLSMMQGRGETPDMMQFLDFGLVMEATDPAQAQTFAAKLNTAITMMGGQSPDVTITTEEMFGTEVTVISAVLDEGLTADVVVGANDEIFFIASRSAAETLLSGDGTIASSPAFQEASKYFLPNATSTWYTDNNGVAVMTIIPLTLLGPAIGNVFDNIQEDLNGAGAPSSNYAMNVSNTSQGEQELQIIEQLMGLINGATASSAVIDGTRLTRITLSLNLE